MAAPTFDTHDAVRKLRGAGIGEEAAEGIVGVVQEATSPFVTREILQLELHQLRSELYRALWIQGAGIVAAISGLLAAAVAVASIVN